MKSASVPKSRLWIKATTAWGCFYTRSPIAYGRLFVRTQSTIRADGFLSAQHRNSNYVNVRFVCDKRSSRLARLHRAAASADHRARAGAGRARAQCDGPDRKSVG